MGKSIKQEPLFEKADFWYLRAEVAEEHAEIICTSGSPEYYQYDNDNKFHKYRSNHTDKVFFVPVDVDIEELARERAQQNDEVNLQLAFRLSRHASIYQTTDRILTNQDVDCLFQKSESDMPAFNDGKQIVFNTKVINTKDMDSDDFLLNISGLNYHEVAHILWTPRQNSEFLKQVVESELLVAFNVLEDNRIETFMTQKYPSTIPFMLISMRKYFLTETNPLLFAVIGGRTYLPQEIIDEAYFRFANHFGDSVAQRIAQIISSYRTLVLPNDKDKALELIKEYAELLDVKGNGEGATKTETRDTNADGTPMLDREGNPTSVKSERAVPMSNNAKSIAKVSTCASRQPAKTGRPEAGSKQEGIEKPSDIQITEGNPMPSNDESDNNTDKGDKGLSVGDGTDKGASDDEVVNRTEDTPEPSLIDMFDRHINKPQTQELINSELRRLRQTIRNIGAKSPTIMKWNARNLQPVSENMRVIANQFATEIVRAEIDCDPYWNTEQKTGRLNVQKAMRADINDFDKVFDKWEFNDKGTDFESVILLDNSGSMGGAMVAVCESAWIIKKAFDTIQGSTSVITFSSRSKRLFDSNDRVSATHYPFVGADADTQPYDGLIEARRLFDTSQRPNKVLFILTDGAWSDEDNSNAEILKLKQQGVLVVVMGFRIGQPCMYSWNAQGEYVKEVFKVGSPEYLKAVHYCDTYISIDKIDQLPTLAKDIVTSHFMYQEA